MSAFHAATAVLIALGAAVLILAVGRTRALLRMRRVTPHAGPWRILVALIGVFVVGYIGALVSVLVGLDGVLLGLTGPIFAGGAVFVYLAVRVSHATLRALVQSSMSQRQVGDVLEALGDAVMLVDDAGIVRMVNRRLCELVGLPSSAIVGKTVKEAVGFDVPTGGVQVSAEMPYFGEHELRRRAAAETPVSIAVVPAEAQGGVVCVLKDIREERQRRRQLDDAVKIAEEVLRARSEFMALIAIELQDPLEALSRSCRPLVQALPGVDVAAKAREVTAASRALEQVVQNLLEIGRLGGNADGARTFYPAALLREVSESLAVEAARTGTDVRHYVDEAVPKTFRGREAQIRQVLELVGRYAIGRAPGGEVRFAVELVPGDAASHHLLFSVRDTGPALSDSQSDFDFDPLASGVRTTAGRLDLVICRLLVLSLGGRISAGNTAGNTATVFFTVLGGASNAPISRPPMAVEPATEESYSQENSQTWRSSSLNGSSRLARLALPEPLATSPERRRGSILVVDDSATSRELLAHQLRQAGHSVEVAGTATEALDVVWQQDFDVILLDVLLPDSDGIAVLEQLRAKGVLERLSVLMISAVDETTSVAACIERGAEDFLPKPVSPAILRARLGACLEKQFLRDRSKQQLGQLASESRRANELLRVLLPDPIADELQSTGSIAPRRRENVAVMFADLVGFTAYCDRHSPEEVLVSLQELFTRFEVLAEEHGVQKVKTIGDSFMGAAGLFAADERPALRCVALGQAMIAALAGHPIGWKMRIGVHVGPVVGGVAGTRQYLYDIWGDTVNTAQRIEHAGRDGSVCVSAAARRQIEPAYTTRSLGSSAVKGKGELEIFEVVEGQR